jgi:hypothetical protein
MYLLQKSLSELSKSNKYQTKYVKKLTNFQQKCSKQLDYLTVY